MEWGPFILLGLVPPIGLWLLWAVQRGTVELLRKAMVKMVRQAGWLYHTVSWFGTFLHEISHAVVLLLTGLGIRNFSVRSEQGHVTPRRTPKSTLGAIAMIVAALAPMFAVPALVFVAATLLLNGSLIYWQFPGAAVDDVVMMGRRMVHFSGDLLTALASLDVTRWRHGLLATLVLLGAPGTRPSFVKGKGIGGATGDLAVVRQQMRRRPWLHPIAPLLIVAGYLFVLPWKAAVYWAPLQAFWVIAITGIEIALIGAIIWWGVARNSRTTAIVAWIPWLALVALQVGLRAAGTDIVVVNAASIGAWWLLCQAGALLLPKRDAIDRVISK